MCTERNEIFNVTDQNNFPLFSAISEKNCI